MKYFLGLILLSQTVLASNIGELTSTWNEIVKANIAISGGVDYVSIQKDIQKLDNFLGAHKNLTVKGLADNEKKALFINLYNAFMIKSILDYAKDAKITVSSPDFLKIKVNEIKFRGSNIWNGQNKVNLAGVDLNLDEIEHGLIRGEGKGALADLKVSKLDPRIHAAVNCAAISCPRVREKAYLSENIDEMLDSNLREFINSTSQFQKVGNKLEANSIVLWYYEDFDHFAKDSLKLKGAGDYLIKFLDASRSDSKWIAQHLTTNFNDRSKFSLRLSSDFSFQYNWQVNDKRNK
ncbi:MAG: DUF547 domain-containing protein [Pseudomonadota bacterium]